MSDNDNELIRKANDEIDHERLLVAARYLHKVKNEKLLTDIHHLTMKRAQMIQDVINVHLNLSSSDINNHDDDNSSSNDHYGWTKQSESHGNHDTIVYYKVVERSKLICRIESPIEQSLLVPLMAVFNESQLYANWMPKFTFPFKMGVRESMKLKEQPGRGAQIMQTTIDMPFPIADREVIIDAYAADCIDEYSLISMKGISLTPDDDKCIEPPKSGIKRIDFDVGWTVRQCPSGHPCLQQSNNNKNKKKKYPDDEHLLLLTLTQYCNPHVSYVPTSFINFSTRTALMGQWQSLLQVATDVKEGKRPDHDQCIADKPELYGWINERIEALFTKLDQDKKIIKNNIDKKQEVQVEQ